MKRQALGKGLSSLIPEGNSSDPLAAIEPAPRQRKKEGLEQMSAADMAMSVEPSTAENEGPEVSTKDVLSPSSSARSTSAADMEPGHPAVTGGGGTLQWIDIDRIRPNRFQPRTRFPDTELDELTASIRSSGILQPLLLRRQGTGYELIAGERRWRAAQKAGLRRVPAILREIPDDRLLETALIENIQRQELNAIEEARAYATLIEKLGLTQSEIAERVGRERSSIANYLRLLALSPKVQGLIEEGQLSMGHARALAGLPGPKAQELGADLILRKGMSVREAEAWVRRHTEEPRTKHTFRRDPNVSAAEESLQRTLGTRVRIVQGRGEKGKIVIEYFSTAELDRLYERLARN